MMNGWRLRLRQAEDAFARGRLDEAGRLLSAADIQDLQPARQLQQEVAMGLAQRAQLQLATGDQASGWRSLDAARELGGETDHWLAARQEFVNRIFADVEDRLAAGDASGAGRLLDDLEKHRVAGRAVQAFREAARRLQSAQTLVARGQFAEADRQFSAAVALLQPRSAQVEQEQQRQREAAERFRKLEEQLHRLLQEREWTGVLSVADSLLSLAPEYAMAQRARQQAWAAVQPQRVPRAGRDDAAIDATVPLPAARLAVLGTTGEVGPRSLLWVDAVGGYLVCHGEEVVLGQALPGNAVEIPLLADISRRHAVIRREGGSYILEPLQAVKVAGKVAVGKTLLSDGDEIELGSVVRLRFRQPHALSATACLEFATPHRTQPPCDAILLLAESCVLGPGARNHVVCRDWAQDVVLFRQGESLFCRASEPLEVDGELVTGRARLRPDSRICGNDFSMSLEELDKCTNKRLL